MKKRALYYSIIKQLNHKNALIITGMRQVGKTTLMKQIYEFVSAPKLWFDFDNPIDMKFFEEIQYKNIFHKAAEESGAKKGERIFIFIDEIQNFPEITKIIKYLIDHYKIKFILTGSSNFYLKNLFPESLSGRKFLYKLQPLSFQEFLYFNDIIKEEQLSEPPLLDIDKKITQYDFEKYELLYESFINFGGFPEVVITPDSETKKLILKNIFSSFFEKDIRILSDFKDIRELRDLILLLIPRTGSTIDISRLSQELGVQRYRIYQYLEFLIGVFFITALPKYSKSIDRSVAGGKKIFFSDTGLLNSLGKVNEGQLFENSVINQLLQYGNVSFYNKKNTAEIDAVLENRTAFEIKLSGTQSDINKLQKLSSKLGINKYYVISKKFKKAEHIISPVVL